MNVPYMAVSTQTHMQPFMALAEQLGSVIAQLSESPIKRVELRTWGGIDTNITTKAAKMLLEAKVLQGIEKYSNLGECCSIPFTALFGFASKVFLHLSITMADRCLQISTSFRI